MGMIIDGVASEYTMPSNKGVDIPIKEYTKPEIVDNKAMEAINVIKEYCKEHKSCKKCILDKMCYHNPSSSNIHLKILKSNSAQNSAK